MNNLKPRVEQLKNRLTLFPYFFYCKFEHQWDNQINFGPSFLRKPALRLFYLKKPQKPTAVPLLSPKSTVSRQIS